MGINDFLSNFEKTGNGEYFRKSKLSDHETAFELWDTVYVMFENQIVEARISEINIQIVPMPTTTKLTNVRYKLTRNNKIDSKNYMDYFTEVDQSQCFASKEELKASL